MNKVMYKTRFVFGAIAVCSVMITRCSEPNVESSVSSLAHLQRRYFLAKTDSTAKGQVIMALEEYYLRFAVPDSLRQKVEYRVTQQLNSTKIADVAISSDTNIYRQEAQLQNILQNVLVACARAEREAFQKMLDAAQQLAQIVAAGTASQYWVLFCQRLALLTPSQARNALMARISEKYAYDEMKVKNYAEAEGLAALALQQRLPDDERLRLDSIQRLQTILHEHYSRHELSIGLAEAFLPLAKTIKYHLRASGLLYMQAESFFEQKDHQATIACLDTVIANAERFSQLANMSWFRQPCLLRKIDIYTELGEFTKAWRTCDEVDWRVLDNEQFIWLHIAKSNLFLETGHYAEAEAEINIAKAHAEKTNDVANRVKCLINLGVLYGRLSEPARALFYYRQAEALLNTTRPNPVVRLLILANSADILSARNDTLQFEQAINAAKTLLRQVENPYREALLLTSIGNRYRNAKKVSTALQYFTEADSVADQNSFWSYALKCKIERVDCLIKLSHFWAAENLLASIKLQAEAIDDVEILIEAYDLLGQLYFREGQVELAAETLQRLLCQVDTMSVRMARPALLMAYRQKIYDGLKRAVFYDLAMKNYASAFDKLAQAKDCVLRRLLKKPGDKRRTAQQNLHRADSLAAQLPAQALLLDYLIMPDSLYVFMLAANKPLTLLRKKIDYAALQQMAQAYRDSIRQTSQRFKAYKTAQIQAHYDGTIVLAQQLYRELLGWAELEQRLRQSQQLYIVPDEFLHEISFETLIGSDCKTPIFLANEIAVSILPSIGLLTTAPSTNGTAQLRKCSPKILLSVDRQFPDAERFVTQTKLLYPNTEELTLHYGQVTKATVLAALQNNYSIYIFVGHGLANAEFPEQGYISLCVKLFEGGTQSVDLTVADLRTINWLDADMVMLIGCETAGITLYRGTGISGLQREFLRLGAKTVLGNLWKADATYAIPQAWDFLSYWSATGNAAPALQESQKKTIQTLQKKTGYYRGPHPYFWGSPVLLTTTIH